MKNLIIISLFLLSSLFSFGQVKSIGVMATKIMWADDGEVKTDKADEVYVFSFADNIMTHVVFGEGVLNAAQVYSISKYTTETSGDYTILKTSATSGVSGNTYNYSIKFDKDGKLIDMVRQQPNGGVKETFTGYAIDGKSFKQ